MPLTITTTYKGPSNFRGSYIMAKCDQINPKTGKPTVRRVPYDSALSSVRNHEHAAHCLAVFAGIEVDEWVKGELGNGYVFTPYFGEVVVLGKARELAEAHARSNAIIANAMKG